MVRTLNPTRLAVILAIVLSLLAAAAAIPSGAGAAGTFPYSCTISKADFYAACSDSGQLTKDRAGQSIKLSQTTPGRTCRHRFQTPGVNNAFEVLVSAYSGPVEIGTTYMWAGYIYNHWVRCGLTYTGQVQGVITKS